MKTARIIFRTFPWVIIAMLSFAPAITAQETAEPAEAYSFSREELTQMLAPIALYPDSLIAQILMASTYPLEVVDAERWLRQNRELDENELDAALLDKPWDTSVKSLCHLPDLLFAMSDRLDQTTKLGDAFIGQEDDVMATIQDLRRRAENQGNLRSNREQRIVNEGDVIQIEPADPDVVYVPVYDPLYVYGPWWYPAFPPFYWYFPSDVAITGGYIGFGPGIFLGFNIFSWSWFDWHNHRIHLDYRRTGRFDRDRFRHGGAPSFWSHNPEHRRGVAYRDRGTSRRFGAGSGLNVHRGPETRGYPAGDLERRIRGGGPSRPPHAGGEVRGRPERPDRNRFQNTPRSYNPFRGIGNGSFESRAGERGSESRRSGEIRSPRTVARPLGGAVRQPSRNFSGPSPGIGSHSGVTRSGGGGSSRSGGVSGGHGGGRGIGGGRR